MSDNIVEISNTPLSPSEELDTSHLSDATRARMQRVRELEQQRLQRVLARSVVTAQQTAGGVSQQEPSADRQTPVVRSGMQVAPSIRTRSTVRSRYTSQQSPGLSSTRSMSEDPLPSPTLPGSDSDSNDSVVARAGDLVSRSAENVNVVQGQGSEVTQDTDNQRNTLFIKKLEELASKAESEEMKGRYLRLLESEKNRLTSAHDPEVSRGTSGGIQLSRSTSVNEHVSVGRLSRRNSDQIRRRASRLGSPVTIRRNVHQSDNIPEPQLSRASSTSNIYTPDLSVIDKLFDERRQESLQKLEEITRQRQQGIRSLSLDSEPPRSSTTDRFFNNIIAPQIDPGASVLFSRTNVHEPSIQYSSIEELHEDQSPRFGSDSALNQAGVGILGNLHRASGRENVNSGQSMYPFRDFTSSDMTYVDDEGNTQPLTPSSPLYQRLQDSDRHLVDRITSQLHSTVRDAQLKERKKRSLLVQDGLEDHFLAECFDPDITFEERIGLIREKLYGSKVLIPSDKRCAMSDRGCPDGASHAVKDSATDESSMSDGQHR